MADTTEKVDAVTNTNEVVESATPTTTEVVEERKFTQKDIDRIVQERLSRAKKEVPEDYEELKQKAAKYSELEEKYKTSESKIEELNQSLELSNLVQKVSGEYNIPSHLLHGTTEEELTNSAKAIQSFVSSQNGYPKDKGGSVTGNTVSKESIEQIKDPLERIAMRAKHIDLYK